MVHFLGRKIFCLEILETLPSVLVLLLTLQQASFAQTIFPKLEQLMISQVINLDQK